MMQRLDLITSPPPPVEWALSDLHGGNRDTDLSRLLWFIRSGSKGYHTLRLGDSIDCTRFLAEIVADPQWEEYLMWLFGTGLNLPGNHDRLLTGAQPLGYSRASFDVIKDSTGRRVGFTHGDQFSQFYSTTGPLRSLREWTSEEILKRAWLIDHNWPGLDEALLRLIDTVTPAGSKQDPEEFADKASEWGRSIGVSRVITGHTHALGIWRRPGCEVFNLGSAKKGNRMGAYKIHPGILYEVTGTELIEVGE